MTVTDCKSWLHIQNLSSQIQSQCIWHDIDAVSEIVVAQSIQAGHAKKPTTGHNEMEYSETIMGIPSTFWNVCTVPRSF